MKKISVSFVAIFLSMQLFCQTPTKSWTWTELNWAPCKGVGINATAAFEVTAEVSASKDNGKFLLKNLMVRVKAGVSKVHYSGSLLITAPGGKKETFLLDAPRYTTMDRAEGPRVVLVVPQKDSNRPKESIGDVFVCNDCSVQVIVTMVANLSGGACVLGTTKHTLNMHK
ncbi:MAG: hypothetical protein IPI23_01075 [Bacteroidetes bacterium]|nr:hypothetical protein [Bacteroidota bacterium]